MARLPNQYDLSGPANLRSGRAIASIDTSGLTRGVAQMGAQLENLGAEIHQQQATVDVARAEAYKTKGLIDVSNEFTDDGDYSTFNQRAPAKTGDVVKKAADLIRDPRVREKWQLGAQTDAVRTNDAIGDKARTLGKQAETVAFDDALEVNRRIYVDPDTPEDAKAKARADIEGALSVGSQSGLLTPEQAAARKDKFVEGADYSRASLLSERDPNKVIGWLGRENDIASVKQAKSFLKTKTDKDASHIDGMQGPFAEKVATMIASAPAEIRSGLGVYSGARSNERQAELWKDALAKYGSAEAARKWVAPPGHSEHNKGNAADLSFNGQSLKNAPPNVVEWVHANAEKYGLKFPLSNENWHIEDSSTRGGEKAPAFVASLSPEQRDALFNKADARSRQISAEAKGDIENVVQNAPVAIQNTGQYDGSVPTFSDFANAYGYQDGSERYAKFNASMDVGQKAYDFRTMSSEDIQAAVTAAIPQSSGNDAALETAKHDALQKAATSTLAARNADPATYTRQAFPSVNQAWDDAQASGDYQKALSATAAAQQQLGIKNMQLMPKAVADQSVTNFKDGNLPATDRLNAVSGLVFSTADPGQRQAVYKQLVDAGMPAAMDGVFEAMARGDQGAASRLMEAVVSDPAKLPSDRENTPALINENVYSNVWAPGELGYTAYGLAYGDASSLERAQRGTELLNKAVRLRLSRGDDMDTAVAGAKKDLFGDKVVFEGDSAVNADLAISADVDQSALADGLARSKDVFKQALNAQRDQILSGAGSAEGGQRAILTTTTENRINDIINEGVFVQTGNGIGLRDPYTGQFVSGADGKPLSIPMETVLTPVPGYKRPAPNPAIGSTPGAASDLFAPTLDIMGAP